MVMGQNTKVYSPSGEKLLIPEEQVKEAVSSGYRVATPKEIIESDEPVKVYSPEGERVFIPKEQLEEATQEGYREATPARIKAVEKVKQMGALGAGAAKFTNQLLMDVPETVNEVSGNEEGIALADEMKRQYPTASTIGSVTGFGAGLLTPVGPAGLLAKMGSKAASHGLAKMAATTGTKELAKKILAGSVRKGAIEAAGEGLAMALPTAATQTYFGDTNSAAETLFLHGGGFGALAGGTFGGLRKILKGADKTTGVVDKMANWFEKKGNEYAVDSLKARVKFTKKIAQDTGIEEAGEILRKNKIIEKFDTQENILEKLNTKINEHGGELGAIRDNLDNLATSSEESAKFIPKRSEIIESLKKELPELYKNPRLNASKIRAIEDSILDISEGGTEHVSYSEIADLANVFNDKAGFEKATNTGLSDIYKGIRSKIVKYSDDLADKLTKSHGEDELFSRFKELKKEYGVFKTSRDGIQDSIHRGISNKKLGLTDTITGVGAIGAGVATGGVVAPLAIIGAKKGLEKYGSPIASDLASSTSKALRKSALTIEANAASKGILGNISKTKSLLDSKESVIRPVAVKTGLDWLKSSQEEDKQFNENFEKVNDLYQNIDKVTNDLSKESEALNDFDVPELPAQYTAHTANAIAYAHNAIPKKPIENPMFKSRPWKPSKTEVREFNAKIAAIDNPFIIYDQFHSGFIDRASLDAVKNVYPSIFGHIQKEFYDQLSERPRDFSYQTKLMLANLLGVPMDNSVDPTSIQYYQQVINKQTAQIAQAKQNSQVKLKNNLTSPVASLSESKV
jgi:hypothetical protein